MTKKTWEAAVHATFNDAARAMVLQHDSDEY